MVVNIVLKDDNNSFSDMFENVGIRCHANLTGNKDYVDSNVILNVDHDYDGRPACSIIIDSDKCEDIDLIAFKAKEVVDLFMVALKEKHIRRLQQ